MLNSLNRRQWFRRGGLLATVPALFNRPQRASAAVPATAGKLRLGPDIYQSIGVRPLINCRGTLTVISGSLELPEVRAAVDNGGLHHVALDELMEAVAGRLAEITGAEWALVSAGCAAGWPARLHAGGSWLSRGDRGVHGDDSLRLICYLVV